MLALVDPEHQQNLLTRRFTIYEHVSVHVISRPALNEFAGKHPDSKAGLDAWYKLAKKARWRNLAEIRLVYPQADPVGTCTAFNISGNKYRLVTKVKYKKQTSFIRNVLTHAEYSRGKWKNECDC